VRALADRDFARASDHFLRTLETPVPRRIYLALCLYALCLSGREEEADRTLSARWADAKKANVPGEYWAWMKATFGLQAPAN
jgi:hypothetical protein